MSNNYAPSAESLAQDKARRDALNNVGRSITNEVEAFDTTTGTRVQDANLGGWGFARERLVHPNINYRVMRSGMASWGYTGTAHNAVTNINVVHPNVPAFNCSRPYSSTAKDSVLSDVAITFAVESSKAYKDSVKDGRPARSVFFFPKPVKFTRNERGYIEVYRNENRYALDVPLNHLVFKQERYEGGFKEGPYLNPKCLVRGCEGFVLGQYAPVVYIFNSSDRLIAIGEQNEFNYSKNECSPHDYLLLGSSGETGYTDRETMKLLLEASYAPWTSADPEGKAERDEKDRVEREKREKLLADNNRAAEEIKEAQRRATLLAVDKLALEEKESKARDEVRAKLKRDQEESDRLRKQEEDSKAANDKLVADALADAEALAADQEAKDRASGGAGSIPNSKPKKKAKTKPKGDDEEELGTLADDASDGPSAMTIGLVAGGGLFTLILLILLLKKASRG